MRSLYDGLNLKISDALARYGFKRTGGDLEIVYKSDIQKKKFVIDISSLQGVVREVEYDEPEIQIETNIPTDFDLTAFRKNTEDFFRAKEHAERVVKEVKKKKTRRKKKS